MSSTSMNFGGSRQQLVDREILFRKLDTKYNHQIYKYLVNIGYYQFTNKLPIG